MNLLASSGAWVLDVIFFALILGGILIGVAHGFLRGVCKLAGTVFAVAFAFFFCMPMHGSLEKSFGLTTALTKAFGNATVAGWVSIAISFVALFVIVKVGAWLIGKFGTSLVERIAPLRVVNRVLGGLLGLAKALILIFLLLALCSWINAPAINECISSSAVVGSIYNWEWFRWAVALPGTAIREHFTPKT